MGTNGKSDVVVYRPGTSGWYVLDDTATALLWTGSPGFAVRPAHAKVTHLTACRATHPGHEVQ